MKRLIAQAQQVAQRAAQARAARIAQNLRSAFPRLRVEQDGPNLTIAGRGLARLRLRDARLRNFDGGGQS